MTSFPGTYPPDFHSPRVGFEASRRRTSDPRRQASSTVLDGLQPVFEGAPCHAHGSLHRLVWC
jgi:hypothetical protein